MTIFVFVWALPPQTPLLPEELYELYVHAGQSPHPPCVVSFLRALISEDGMVDCFSASRSESWLGCFTAWDQRRKKRLTNEVRRRGSLFLCGGRKEQRCWRRRKGCGLKLSPLLFRRGRASTQCLLTARCFKSLAPGRSCRSGLCPRRRRTLCRHRHFAKTKKKDFPCVRKASLEEVGLLKSNAAAAGNEMLRCVGVRSSLSECQAGAFSVFREILRKGEVMAATRHLGLGAEPSEVAADNRKEVSEEVGGSASSGDKPQRRGSAAAILYTPPAYSDHAGVHVSFCETSAESPGLAKLPRLFLAKCALAQDADTLAALQSGKEETSLRVFFKTHARASDASCSAAAPQEAVVAEKEKSLAAPAVVAAVASSEKKTSHAGPTALTDTRPSAAARDLPSQKRRKGLSSDTTGCAARIREGTKRAAPSSGGEQTATRQTDLRLYFAPK